MRMAVATNPNETALTESSKRLQYSSLSGFKGDTAGNAGAIAPHFCSPPIKTKPQLSNNKKKNPLCFCSLVLELLIMAKGHSCREWRGF